MIKETILVFRERRLHFTCCGKPHEEFDRLTQDGWGSEWGEGREGNFGGKMGKLGQGSYTKTFRVRGHGSSQNQEKSKNLQIHL